MVRLDVGSEAVASVGIGPWSGRFFQDLRYEPVAQRGEAVGSAERTALAATCRRSGVDAVLERVDDGVERGALGQERRSGAEVLIEVEVVGAVVVGMDEQPAS